MPDEYDRSFMENDDEIFLPHVLKGVNEAQAYSVNLVSKGQPAGAGTLVESNGRFGIITADHVVDVLRRDDAPIGLVIADYLHRFELDQKHVEFETVGKATETAEGPDLALIRIFDLDKIGTLKAKRSFYPLGGHRFLPEEEALENHHLWIIGGPAEFARRDERLNLLESAYFHGRTDYGSHEDRGGFDYVSVSLFSGLFGFPSNYQGVSGGGLWAIPLAFNELSEGGIEHHAPLLVGVVFYQSVEENSRRILHAHGPRSVEIAGKFLGLTAGGS